MRRRLTLSAVVLSVAAALTACTAGPAPIEPSASASRPSESATDDGATFTRPETASDDAIVRRGNGSVPVTFDEPTQVAQLEVLCVGGRGTFEASVMFADDVTVGMNAPFGLTCDGTSQTVPWPELALMGPIETLTTSLRVGDVLPEYTVIATPAQPDEWEGYYDDVPLTVTAESTMWGSFGSPDAISGTNTTNMTIAAGDHVVRVDCAGAAEVTITMSDAEMTDILVSEDVACGESRDIDVSTQSEGLMIQLDSDGEAGAYHVMIDPSK